MTSLIRRLWYRATRSRHDADLAEEMETHRQLRQAQLEREGLSPADAALASRRALGNVTLAREEARDVWTFAWLEHAWQDLALALRGLRHSKTFTVVAVGTLALGIGANTALFSIFNSLLLRELPVREPSRLVILHEGSWTYPIWRAVEAQTTSLFEGAFAYSNLELDLAVSGQRQPVDAAYASGRLFDVLGVTATRGRLLQPSDDRPDANTLVAVISHRFWQQRYAGADSAIGATLTLDRQPFTIVGVMPASFAGPDVGRLDDVIIPFAAEPVLRGVDSGLDERKAWWLEIMGRLKPGVSLEQANAALVTLQPGIRAASIPADTESFLEDPLTLVSASTGRSPLRNRFETPLRAMQATVAVVLLIACASLANLMLARALARRRELSVRLALGASRWRVTRLLAVETAVIVAAGAGLGVLFAKWSSALLVQQLATWRGSVFLDLSLDWRVLGFTAGLAAVTAVIAGIVPALSVTGVAPGDAMKESSRTVTGDRRMSVRGALVVAQIALSLVLVIGAGLFLRTFAALSGTRLGFAAGGLTVANVNLPAAVAEPAARRDLLERLDAAIAAAPGVRAAGLSVIAPITGSGWNDQIGTAGGAPTAERRTYVNAITPHWFEAMGIRRRSGRDFDRNDRIGTPDVTIVNETFARRFLAGRPPVGQRITAGGPRNRKEFEVVGVVSDAVYRSLREGVVPTMYLPLAAQESPGSRITLTLSTSTAARSTVDRLLADTLHGVDPALTFSIRNFDQFIRGGLIQERLVAMLSGFFGGLALLLAAIGLYGVVAHAVDVRRTEIGVRIALGADRLGILVLVFRRVAVMLALGLAAGLCLSLWASRFVGALLFRLEPRDVTTFAGALAVLMTTSALAAWIPARRASRIDPAQVLREG
jgi:putative ABC transport system permease protein